MKRHSVLEIHFKKLNTLMDDVRVAIRTRKPLLQPKEVIYFDSVVGFRNFMTVQKIEILTTIAIHNPHTLYELAKLVDRDFAGVSRDCTMLNTTGFIDLKSAKDARNSKRPVLKFPYTKILVYLPRTSYQIEFKEAA